MAVMPLNYTFRAEWDPERREYFARCLEFPGRYAEAFTAHEAVAALETVIAEAVAEMVGKLADRPAAPGFADLFD